MKHYKLHIEGNWVDTDTKFEVLDKYSGEPFATIAQASHDQVQAAVRSARKSFATTRLTPYQRYEILRNAADIVRKRRDELAETLVKEVGKPVKEALGEVNGVASNLENIAEEAKRITGEMVPVDSNPGSENRMSFTLRSPVGVVCAITPFNYPLSLSTSKVAPALAAGNTVVLKPTQQTPVSGCQLVEVLLEAGLPAGHIQLLLGPGSKVGEWLLRNPDINFYSLTGSAEVGEHITRSIGLRRCAMELGSNAAVIVHKDADVKKAAAACATRGFYNSGQVCISVQRVLVHEDVYSEFMTEAKAVAESLVLGDPSDPKTTMGPMIGESEVERIAEWVVEAVDEGAVVVTGGEAKGTRFYLPTILGNLMPNMKVWSQEVFGPLLMVNSYRDFDEAIRAVNDSIYGLQAGVYTRDLSLAIRAAREIECGGVIINDTAYYKVGNMPYGGVKQSGFGREGGKYAIKEMTEEKTVVLNL
ncbi:MAG: aldehyde dehydrogenase family protein [Acidobacteriota bacterium]|jgi:acyl-CoA reductase-like NAD-dependent aldehyde dehydrogenase|nr:aldehyde dehydrogenase family protein [Acidobacteriota bacterium]